MVTTFAQQIPEDLSVDADRELLGLALRQLLDNALKYSPPTSTIEILARGNGAVGHHGPQLRLDDSRARAGQARSSGSTAARTRATFREPGWAWPSFNRLPARTAGRLTVSSSPDAGTAFTLSLPREGRTS